MIPLTVHVIDGFTACYWAHARTVGEVRPGSATMIHESAIGYSGLWDVRTRWLWGVAEALRSYEGATGRLYPDAGLLLCPVKRAELHGFLASLPVWPITATRELASHVHGLIAGGMKVRIDVANKADLVAMIKHGDNAIRANLAGRVVAGCGVVGRMVAA
jgi:hypothetical protein